MNATLARTPQFGLLWNGSTGSGTGSGSAPRGLFFAGRPATGAPAAVSMETRLLGTLRQMVTVLGAPA